MWMEAHDDLSGLTADATRLRFHDAGGPSLTGLALSPRQPRRDRHHNQPALARVTLLGIVTLCEPWAGGNAAANRVKRPRDGGWLVPEAQAPQRRTRAQTRERVLKVANDLFYWHGIRAIGVDRIAAEAGVAPTTLYRLFASKDDLIAAYIERADEAYREWFVEVTGADGRGPRERILALFDALLEQIQPERCRGCPFLMALAELPDPAIAGHRRAVEMKAWVHDRLFDLVCELAEVAPVADPAALAAHLTLVMEGAYASVQALGVEGPAGRARALAEAILPSPPARRSKAATGRQRSRA